MPVPEPERLGLTLAGPSSETELDELLTNVPGFPEDSAEPPMVTCGGGCPPAYVLSTEGKDRTQIAARLTYCLNAGAKLWPNMQGTVTVTAKIGKDGKTTDVAVEVGKTIRPPVGVCVRRLVQSAEFGSKNHFQRTVTESKAFPTGVDPATSH